MHKDHEATRASSPFIRQHKCRIPIVAEGLWSSSGAEAMPHAKASLPPGS
jgi:hypothetical protein